MPESLLILAPVKRLANREEQLMLAVWHLRKAFVKDIIARLPDPKPHYNSVATTMRILEKKGYASHESLGGTYRYYPLVTATEYLDQVCSELTLHFFKDSYLEMMAYLAHRQNITREGLETLLDQMKGEYL